MPAPKVTPVDAWKFRQLYAAGMAVRKIGSSLGFSSTSVHRVLKASNTVCRKAGYISRKYHCDDAAFDVIDSEPKAYWLGFLAADGSFGSKGRVLELKLASRDRSQLENFMRFLDSDYPIHEYKGTGFGGGFLACQVDISSERLVSSVKKYGLVSHRNDSMPWPELGEFNCDFLRGYSDGDGCFYRDPRRKSHNVKWEILGGRNFLTSASAFLEQATGCKRRIPDRPKPNAKVWRLSYFAQSDVAAIARLIYSSATIFLQRKFDIVRPLLDAPGLVTGSAI